MSVNYLGNLDYNYYNPMSIAYFHVYFHVSTTWRSHDATTSEFESGNPPQIHGTIVPYFHGTWRVRGVSDPYKPCNNPNPITELLTKSP